MAFERPISIKEALDNVQDGRYALPAIQRNFVWSPEQIEELFDSLMQGYPVGAFLFWRVEPGTSDNYRWYGFTQHFDQRSANKRPEFRPLSSGGEFTAVLDGQQRLTALNIGLTGSYAAKLPRLRWNNPDAFPKKFLYYNVSSELEDDEYGAIHEFRFMTPTEASGDEGVWKWFKVGDIMRMKSAADVNDYMMDNGLLDNIMGEDDRNHRKRLQNRIANLQEAIHTKSPISYYLEGDQDPDRVLHIFARTNRAGTTLKDSDLLLSIATAQWKSMDARQVVTEQFEYLNEIGDGFGFDTDFVLKAAFVLSDLPNIGLRVSNFTSANVQQLENHWDRSMGALRTAVELAARFGLSGEKRLSSQNAVIPIAYYAMQRNLDSAFVSNKGGSEDRDRIRVFLFRTLIGDVWSRATDTVLTLMRNVIRESNAPHFPSEELEERLAQSNRSLTFDNERLEEIVESSYGARAFVLLSMFDPDLMTTQYRFHMDHFFPTSALSDSNLRREGLPDEEIQDVQIRRNQLPNLILLQESENTAKGAKLPHLWLEENFESEGMRETFARNHDLGDIPDHVSGFVDWYEARRARMLKKLQKLIGRE